MTPDQIIFLFCAALIIVSALMVVITGKLIHAALWLVSTLFGVAILFVILQAGFLAVVQVVVYIGAIAILFIFAVMLTRRGLLENGEQTRSKWWLTALPATLILASLVIIISEQRAFDKTALAIPGGLDSLQNLGAALVSPSGYLLPFEVASILLLAALVGAVYLATGAKK